ncbi:MAG TPA: guanine deaminase [Steroidobacteraceae bacterium]|jgi:guanine deaminase|nr:guanine deaminase [Steroidobacteraceae bacterium]
MGDLTSERGFRGTFLHAPQRGQLQCLKDTLIVVAADGAISAIGPAESADGRAAAARLAQGGRLVALGPQHFVLPGMVDLHVHAPQWPQVGAALDLPLEDWLQKFTFPLESRYADPAFAVAVYESLVANLLANGTTTALYFATLHLQATKALADICLRRSQRALIGRVAMDNPDQCPEFYRDASAGVATRETREFIRYVQALPGSEGLILPVITPRFIPSCTDELLGGLGTLARETGCHVQTHCSESDWQHRYVLERCGRTDTAALDSFGLLGRRTVLAHGNFVDDADAALIRERGAGIAHCPLSNVYFSDAVFPLRRILDAGVHVGLGTDIAGGASPSLLENARQAITSSRLLESGVDARLQRQQRRQPGSRIDALTAFWLATAGGGIALDLPVGVFAPGYQFDACVLDVSAPQGNLRIGADEPPETVLQKLIYGAARANISQVWVANRRVV